MDGEPDERAPALAGTDRPRPDRSHRDLAALLVPERRAYAGVAALVAIAGSLPVAAPLLTRLIIDRAAGGAPTTSLWPLAAAAVVAAIGAQLASIAAAWWATTVAWRSTDRLRAELTGHTLDLGLDYHARHGTGAGVQRIDGDLTSVSDLLGSVVKVVGVGVVTLVATGVSLFALSPMLGVGYSLYLAAFAGLIVAIRRRSVGESAAEMGATGALLGEIEEALGAAEDLRALDAADHVRHRLLQHSRDWAIAVRTTFDAWLSIHRLVQGGVTAGLLLAIGASGFLLGTGALTVGTSFALLQFALQSRRPLDEMLSQLDQVQRAAGAMRRVAELRAEPPAVPDDGDRDLPEGPVSVTLDGVGFAYGDGPTVLGDVNLDVPAGTRLGLVGRTGSGKTTLARLILRMADPGTGSVTLGGVDLRDLRLDDVRRRVAFLDQHARLFTATLRDNVRLFAEAGSRSDDEVREALDAVGLSSLVASLPDGLDTVVGPGGTALSAGEAQLVSLARVWLRDPSLIVLDEATASVDPATEARIAAAVDALLAGRTAVIVAHRLSTLDRVDQIAVLDRGRVVESGPRAELADGDGAFAALLALDDEDNDGTSPGSVGRPPASVGTSGAVS